MTYVKRRGIPFFDIFLQETDSKLDLIAIQASKTVDFLTSQVICVNLEISLRMIFSRILLNIECIQLALLYRLLRWKENIIRNQKNYNRLA
jgi:hypothetical protein